MQHTWQTHHLPKLEVSSLEAGDVAIGNAFTNGAPILADLPSERLSFVAPLGSRSDLEWLLRGLHLHPNIRHLVLCGDDRKGVGEALIALWREGLDANGRLPGSRGILSAELDGAAIDALREYVEILDLRGEPLATVASGVDDLARRPSEAEPRSLPDPAIPKRTVFHSRKTTFPIFSGGVGDAWLQLLNLALRIGAEKQTTDGEKLAEALNAIVTIEPPLLEDGERMEEGFPDFFDFNSEDFDRLFLPDFGARLRDWNGVDHLEAVCDRLKQSVDERAGAMAVLDPTDLASAEVAPGLISATFNAIEGQLFGSFVLGSADVYTDWPLEAMALVRVHREIAERIGLEVGAATFVIHAAYLYERDWERALRVLEASFQRPLPLQVDPSGIFLFGNDGGKATAMLLDHSASTIFWEEGFSDPEDLSWYIIDTMPWLLPQHIRYVGQECAALMRAIREGECYEQG